MKRGDLFLVKHPSSRDPRKQRVFVVVSRQALIDTKYSTVICAPVYTNSSGLTTQVPVGPDQGLKNDCVIQCDELMSLEKSRLTNHVGSLSPELLTHLNFSLSIALGLDDAP